LAGALAPRIVAPHSQPLFTAEDFAMYLRALKARNACVFLFVIALGLAGVANGQQAAIPDRNSQAELNEELKKASFDTLLRERDSLTGEIGELTNEIYWINDAITKKEEVVERQKSKKPTEELDQAIKQDIGNAHLSPTDDLNKKLEEKKNLLEQKQQRKITIDSELARRGEVTRVQEGFKFEMSLIFAILVAVVFILFFWVALSDSTVRREIFSGQTGIQFVTLFLLVIAIILFGIIGILEGKELAALLGGLSGYILGRSTLGNHSTQTPTPAGGGGTAGGAGASGNGGGQQNN
jgi:hypothetical protein